MSIKVNQWKGQIKSMAFTPIGNTAQSLQKLWDKDKIKIYNGKAPQKDRNKSVAFPQKSIVSCLLRVPVPAREKDTYQLEGRERMGQEGKRI